MNGTTLTLLGAGLFLAWILGPAIVLVYRCAIIPLRYEEIRERFLTNNPTEQLMPQNERAKSGAWHYARLLDPDADPANPEEIIQRQFWKFHGWNRYWLPLILVIVLSGIMLAFSGLWISSRLDPSPSAADNHTNAPALTVDRAAKPAKSSSEGAASVDLPSVGDMLNRIPSAFVMALWGAYVWSLYEILSRRKSGDLTPVELYDIAIRYVTAIPTGYAFSLLVFDTVPGLAAFAISAFPLRDIRQIFRKYTLNKVDDKTQAQSSATTKGYLADTLCGMGNDTITRLQELNIETYLDLAYTDPIMLLIKTGVPIELVLSWIDQAIVSVYAAPHKEALTAYGMPCSLDMCEFYARHCWDVANNAPRPWTTDPAVQALATRLGIPADFVVAQILRSVFEDPHTQFLIRVWYGPASPHTAL